MNTWKMAFSGLSLASALILVGGSLAAQPAPPVAAPAPAPAPHLRPEVFRFVGNDPRSFLGVGVTEINAERSRTLKLKEEFGVEITRIDEGSPAEKAGLKANDVILEYNGQRVEGAEQFVRLVRETPPGRNVRLLVSRAGANQTLTATLGTRKTDFPEGFEFKLDKFPMIAPDMPQAKMYWRSSLLGVEAEALESQLAAYFGVKEGVLVRSVSPGTAAEKAGLKAGDVLLKVDDSAVTNPREVTSAVRSARSKDRKQVPVTVMRERKEVAITVTFEDDPAVDRVKPKARAVRQEL